MLCSIILIIESHFSLKRIDTDVNQGVTAYQSMQVKLFLTLYFTSVGYCWYEKRPIKVNDVMICFRNKILYNLY